ncbi:hypothetical protein AAG906_028962 [Vitis piasezkii]
MHYRQLMTLDIGNDALLCKVFPASLQGQALSWFHRLPPNSVGNFRDLSEAFVGQYLCSARHKQNISTLQNIKMQDNESLREFVKRFGQAVLQVEACSMDAVLQIFKRSICPGTPFFESLAKKPPTTMDDLFKRANKYSMLEDDVRAATQQVMVAGQAARAVRKEMLNLRTGQGHLTGGRKGQEVCLPQRSWPYNRDMSGSPVPGRKARQSRTFKAIPPLGYWGRDVSQHHNSGAPRAPAAPKPVINYINGGPSDEEYDSRRKRQKLLRAASIRERINSIRPGLTGGGPRPIDGTIIFPPMDPTRTLQPHRDALILSLEIGDFDFAGLENPDESYPDSTGHQPHPWETLYCRSKLAQSLSTYNFRWYKSYHPSMSS